MASFLAPWWTVNAMKCLKQTPKQFFSFKIMQSCSEQSALDKACTTISSQFLAMADGFRRAIRDFGRLVMATRLFAKSL